MSRGRRGGAVTCLARPKAERCPFLPPVVAETANLIPTADKNGIDGQKKASLPRSPREIEIARLGSPSLIGLVAESGGSFVVSRGPQQGPVLERGNIPCQICFFSLPLPRNMLCRHKEPSFRLSEITLQHQIACSKQSVLLPGSWRVTFKWSLARFLFSCNFNFPINAD